MSALILCLVSSFVDKTLERFPRELKSDWKVLCSSLDITYHAALAA